MAADVRLWGLCYRDGRAALCLGWCRGVATARLGAAMQTRMPRSAPVQLHLQAARRHTGWAWVESWVKNAWACH